MANRTSDEAMTISGKQFTNLDDYVRGFVAAIRTHRRLTGRDRLEVDIRPEQDLPLVQRIMLR